jgi:hypothetical protein
VENKVIIIDTSIMCCWLNVCGKETCGSDEDKWNYDRVTSYIDSETKQGSTLVLPLPVIIETGNHIAQAKQMRYECALQFVEVITKAVDEITPWAAFTRQLDLLDGNNIKELIRKWPELVKAEQKGNLSMGDIMIKSVADYYASFGNEVVILTGDAGLKTYEQVDISGVGVPRRRK